MEENRKIIVVNGVIFLFLMGCIALAAIALNPWSELRGFGLGAALGVGVAIVFSLYILRIWDPVALRPKGSQSNGGGASCWLPFIVIGGIIAGRLLSTYFESELVDIFVGCILSAIALTLFFLACLAWWHRPKKTT